MATLTRFTGGLIERVLGRLRFPTLFVLTALAFLVDLFVPDALPLADEVLLVLLTALFGSWKKRKTPAEDSPEPAPSSGPLPADPQTRSRS